MDITPVEASADTHDAAFDTLARSLHTQLPRRRVAGLLAAALATGVLGMSTQSATAEAKRKRGKRRRSSHSDTEVETTAIPPNCIYVCCDGTCDSWKMCMRCVTWPKATTTGTVASQ